MPGPGDPDGSGTATIRLQLERGEVCFDLTVSNIGPATAAHIHEGADGVAGPVVIPLDPAPTGGSSSGCISDVDAALLENIAKNPGQYYVNVHNEEFPDGAIRGQLGHVANDDDDEDRMGCRVIDRFGDKKLVLCRAEENTTITANVCLDDNNCTEVQLTLQSCALATGTPTATSSSSLRTSSGGEVTLKFASLGITNWACAMLSTQYWQSSERTSSPVTGMDGVSIVFVAVACDVPAVSVANTVGEPVRSFCAGSIGVPSPTGAQAAANRVTVTAPNRNIREILFIVFSFSGQGRLLLLGEPISLQKPLRNIKSNSNFQVWVFLYFMHRYRMFYCAAGSISLPRIDSCQPWYRKPNL